jgi:regulatory protein
MVDVGLQIPDLTEKKSTKAKSAAYRLLTYRPRSRAELIGKLQEKGFDLAVIEGVLADLERYGYVNDRQFAEQWAAGRLRRRGFGRRRVERELRDKGVERDIIAETLASVWSGDIEMKTARASAERKLKTLRSFDGETCRRRLAAFLERKGFSYDIIRTVLTDLDGMRTAV